MTHGGPGCKTMRDDQLSALLHVVYNVWFCKWKSRVAGMSDDEWQQVAAEAWRIMEQGEDFPVVNNLVISLLYELSARLTGGYTEATRRKILALIEGGQYEHEKV